MDRDWLWLRVLDRDSDREARGVNRMIALEVGTPTFETSYEWYKLFVVTRGLSCDISSLLVTGTTLVDFGGFRSDILESIEKSFWEVFLRSNTYHKPYLSRKAIPEIYIDFRRQEPRMQLFACPLPRFGPQASPPQVVTMIPRTENG